MTDANRWVSMALVTAGIGLAGMIGCASPSSAPAAVLSTTISAMPSATPDPISSAQLCNALAKFEAAMNNVAQLDVNAVGVPGIQAAMQNFSTAATNLADAAQVRFPVEAEQLRQATSSLKNTVAGLSDETSIMENFGALAAGIAAVQDAVANIKSRIQTSCPQMGPPSPPPMPVPTS